VRWHWALQLAFGTPACCLDSSKTQHHCSFACHLAYDQPNCQPDLNIESSADYLLPTNIGMAKHSYCASESTQAFQRTLSIDA